MSRKLLGQQKLGAPVSEAFDALVHAVEAEPWLDFEEEPVGYYFEKMIAGWLLRQMDGALSDAQLQAVNPADVSTITLSLLRDMFRHNWRLLRPATDDAAWINPLFDDVARAVKLPADRLRDDGRSYELDDIGACDWARKLGAPFGLPAEKLFACHSAIVTGAQEEFGASG
jgi:hypothetical protein